jgi:hypothetical protein
MHSVIPFPELVIAKGSVDHFQPQNRLAFAFGIGRRRIKNRTACETQMSRFGQKILWRPFALCNLRNVEASVSKGYREFESTPLRHTVWTAEKFLDIAPKIARNRRDSVIHTFKPDQRNRRAKCNEAALQHFSLEARNSVRFLRGPQANARRSQIDDSAKRT